MLFDFTLTPLDRIQPWGSPGQLNLHWFGLTDGHYWMNVGQSTLFEYSGSARQLGAPRHCNYQVARLYEDVIEALPAIMEHVPADLIPHLTGEGRGRTNDRLTAWVDAQPEPEDDAHWSTVEHATLWIGARELSSTRLPPSLDLAIWSDDEAVHIEWDNRAKLFKGSPAWSAAQGAWSMSRQRFADQVRSFHERFMQAMGQRVREVAAGALPPDVYVDIPGLIREQDARASLSAVNFSPPLVLTDWQTVRRSLQTIHA